MILIQKWNKILIKNFPALWMSAIHIIFPVSGVLFGVGFFYGWANPALDLANLEVYQLIFCFLLSFAVITIQYFRLVNQIKFKILLHFYLFCILGFACIFVCVSSTSIAVIYKLNFFIGTEKVSNDMHEYQNKVLMYVLQEDPIIDSLRLLKKNSLNGDFDFPKSHIKVIYDQMIEHDTLTNYKDSLDFNKILSRYINYHYVFHDDYVGYYDNIAEDPEFMRNASFLDSLLNVRSVPEISIISSEIDIIATKYGLPSTRDYSKVEVLERNNGLGDADIIVDYYEPFWPVKERNQIIFNITSKVIKDHFFFLTFLYLFISIIAGIIFSAAILREAIVSSFIFVTIMYMLLILNDLFYYSTNIQIIEIGLILLISLASIFWYLIKEIKFINWKLCFYIHQINFLFISIVILIYKEIKMVEEIEMVDFALIYFFYPLLLMPINLIYLKIYHKLYFLPKS